jgi:hypothetical protein
VPVPFFMSVHSSRPFPRPVLWPRECYH